MQTLRNEKHKLLNIGWLRASVLGANDGIISTASLLSGVVAANTDFKTTLVVGISGAFAGALSMAAGEYVSVSSQADTEFADLETEKRELADNPTGELKELAKIYVERGLEPNLAREVATQLMARDALAAHAHDELGITEISVARPVQAALSSAASFAVGALIPLVAALLAPRSMSGIAIFVAALISLSILGIVAADVGGAPRARSIIRILLWSILAMATTTVIGSITGHAL